MKNSVIHLISWCGILWKGTVSATGESPETMWNLCLSTNFRTRKLGEITGFFAVLSMNNNLVFKKKILNDNFEKGNCIWFRGSHRTCFVKKSVFKNFASLTVKHLCWNHFLIKLQASSNLKNICKQMLLLCSTGIYARATVLFNLREQS